LRNSGAALLDVSGWAPDHDNKEAILEKFRNLEPHVQRVSKFSLHGEASVASSALEMLHRGIPSALGDLSLQCWGFGDPFVVTPAQHLFFMELRKLTKLSLSRVELTGEEVFQTLSGLSELSVSGKLTFEQIQSILANCLNLCSLVLTVDTVIDVPAGKNYHKL
jgi:hypothetical protein